jgi:hypothetical protein
MQNLASSAIASHSLREKVYKAIQMQWFYWEVMDCLDLSTMSIWTLLSN